MAEDRDTSVLESIEPIRGMRRDDGRASLAVAGGAVAALAGGGTRAASVLVTGYEIGWAVRGVGVLVGGAMLRVTSDRGRRLGLTWVGELGTSGAVAVQLGPWGVASFGLALVTAYGVMTERKVEEAPAQPADMARR